MDMLLLSSEQSSTQIYRRAKGKHNEVSHINDGSCPVSVFLLYVAEITTLLVVQTNRYYHDYTDRLDNGLSPGRDITKAKFFAVGHF
jgi:hypothetical protein